MTQMGTYPGGGFPVPPTPPPTGPPEPTPPQGPGVVAPFPAPPRERNPRIWIGLGAAALVLILCVGGAIVGFVAFSVHEVNAAGSAVDRFLTAIQNQQYSQAYRMQCEAAQQSQSRSEFTSQFKGGHRLVSHNLSQPEAVNVGGTSAYAVPADLSFADGTSDSERFVVISEQSGFSVCGVE